MDLKQAAAIATPIEPKSPKRRLVPLHDWVEVEHVAPKATPGKILLADGDKQLAKVIAVGPGKLLDNGQRAPMSVKVGDIVLPLNAFGFAYQDGHRHVFCRDEELFAADPNEGAS